MAIINILNDDSAARIVLLNAFSKLPDEVVTPLYRKEGKHKDFDATKADVRCTIDGIEVPLLEALDEALSAAFADEEKRLAQMLEDKLRNTPLGDLLITLENAGFQLAQAMRAAGIDC